MMQRMLNDLPPHLNRINRIPTDLPRLLLEPFQRNTVAEARMAPEWVGSMKPRFGPTSCEEKMRERVRRVRWPGRVGRVVEMMGEACGVS